MKKISQNSLIIKFERVAEQAIGSNVENDFASENGLIKRLIGLVKAKNFVEIISHLNLEANPRNAKTGLVTDAITETIENQPELFPFMSKGVLLAASSYEELERSRYRLIINNESIEGILDGGHNTLAIGIKILNKIIEESDGDLPRIRKSLNWEEFKVVWTANEERINLYFKSKNIDSTLDFLVPVEILVPTSCDNYDIVAQFNNSLLDICSARNNNVELTVSAKANHKGYFDYLEKCIQQKNEKLASRIEWKSNSGGEVKAQSIVALAWIALNKIDEVRDSDGKIIEPVSPVKLYSSKGACLKQFDRLMSSPDVASLLDDNRSELKNEQVKDALKIAADLPSLYDYIFEKFPTLYNKDGGAYGKITAVNALNKKAKRKFTPFEGREITSDISPDGFIIPLVYGLQAIIEKTDDGHIQWTRNPTEFLDDHLEAIVKRYKRKFKSQNYDPQKIGKDDDSYESASDAFNMAAHDLLN